MISHGLYYVSELRRGPVESGAVTGIVVMKLQRSCTGDSQEVGECGFVDRNCRLKGCDHGVCS